VHFDWQAKGKYYLCNDISKESPLIIAPGEIKYFYVYFEIPINTETGYHSYEILFQYELQDGWFGGWNDYYWQWKDITDFEVKGIDIADDGHSFEPVVIESDNRVTADSAELYLPSALIPEVEGKNKEYPLQPLDTGSEKISKDDNNKNRDSEANIENVELSDGQSSENCPAWQSILFLTIMLKILIISLFVFFKVRQKN